MLFNFKAPVLPVFLQRTTRHGVPGIWDGPWASQRRREKKKCGELKPLRRNAGGENHTLFSGGMPLAQLCGFSQLAG